jgi:filamentous hemagglutinin
MRPCFELEDADGSPAYVTVVTATRIIEPVWNFSVEGWHTYHVGELGVWVHNECVINFRTNEQARNRALELIGEIDQATRTAYVARSVGEDNLLVACWHQPNS